MREIQGENHDNKNTLHPPDLALYRPHRQVLTQCITPRTIGALLPFIADNAARVQKNMALTFVFALQPTSNNRNQNKSSSNSPAIVSESPTLLGPTSSERRLREVATMVEPRVRGCYLPSPRSTLCASVG